MKDDQRHSRPPPAGVLRVIYDHQRWLTSNGRFGKRMVKEGLDFTDCDLAGVDFSRADLTFTKFSGGSLTGARFGNARLQNSEFRGCDVKGTDFTSADLSGALFDTDHTVALFEGANLERVAWSLKEHASIWEERVRQAEGASEPSRQSAKKPSKPEPL